MRFSFPTFESIRRINYAVLLISLIISIGAWYIISIGNSTDVYMRVLIDYQNIPEDLVVVDGLIPHIDVQIRGPKTLLSTQNAKNPSIVMDLATLRVGKNIIPFAKETWGNHYRAFEVLEIEPTHLSITTEQVVERTLAIVPHLDVSLSDAAFKVVDVNLTPSNAIVKGPKSTVTKKKNVELDVRIDPKEKAGTYTKNFPLVVPEKYTSVSPSSVEITYTVASKRVQKEITRPVSINGPKNNFTVDPQTITFMVEIPEGLFKDKKYLDSAVAQVTPSTLEVGNSAPAALQFVLPEGMTLVDNTPRTIVITRVQ